MGKQAFGVYEQIPSQKTADYTVALTDDIVNFKPTTTALVCTLITAVGNPVSSGGKFRIVNDPASTNVLVVSAAGGTLYGPALLYPGQGAVYESDGFNYYSASPNPGFGVQQVTLSTANVTGMYAAPVQLIPAPGTSRLIRVRSIVGKVVFNSAAFASGGVFIAQYDSTANGAGTNAASGTIAAAIVNGSANQLFTLNGAALTGAAATGFLNKALYASNQTGAFATGDGSVVLTIQYDVVTP